MGVTELNPSTSFLRVQPLDAGQVDRALPLAQSLRVDLSLDEWHQFIKETLEIDGGGIDSVVDENGYILGLAVYRPLPDLRHGSALLVDPFMAADLYGRNEAAKRLLDKIEQRAQARGCGAIHITMDGASGRLPSQDSDSFSRFLENGYEADGLRVCRPLLQKE